MKVYIQCDRRGFPYDYNFFLAQKGFEECGVETVGFQSLDEIPKSEPADIVVGYVGIVRRRLAALGVTAPEMDYPEALAPYLGRKVWKSTANTVNASPEQWPVFMKSVADKRIAGIVIRSPKDLIGCGAWNGDQEVWCSDVVPFVTEWRCFVRYGRILDVRHYKGDWRRFLNPAVVERAVQDWAEAPAGYAMDFGLTEDGRTLLVEVNDGYALGAYGLFYVDYAKLLSARWAELTGTEDVLNF